MLHSICRSGKHILSGVIVLLIIALLTACASQKATQGEAGGEAKLITDITTSEDAESTMVTVKGDRKLTYTAIKQVFPLGVLLDFPGTGLDNIKAIHYPPENDYISSIRATQLEEGGKTARIFIALKKDLPYTVEPDDSGLSVVFPKSGQLAAAEPAEAAETAETEEKQAMEATEPVPAREPPPPATRITSVSAAPQDTNVVITVKADGIITDYKSFTISEAPPRIVYDIPKLKSPFKGEQRIAVKSDQIRKIRHFAHPDKIRIVLETNKSYLKKYTAKPVDDGLQIYVGAPPMAADDEKPASAETAAVEPMPAADVQPSAGEKSEPMPVADVQQPADEKSKPMASDKPAWLNRIDFASEAEGKSAIIVGTTRPVEYKLLKIDNKRLHLKLLNTNLPEYRKRALITTRFQSAVDRVTPSYVPKSKDTIIDVELREGVPYFVKQTDDVIRVNFAASKIPPRPYEDAKLPAWKKVMEEQPATGQMPAATAKAIEPGKKAEPVAEAKKSGGNQPDAKSAEIVLTETDPNRYDYERQERSDAHSGRQKRMDIYGEKVAKKYTGEPIALDFFDTDIKNVFRILKEVSGKNFAIDKGVTGKVTLALEEPVPWDQVLDLVLKMNQLGRTMEGDIIRVASLATLAKEEKLRQDKLEQTQKAKRQEDLITAFIRINYSDAAEMNTQHVLPLLTQGRTGMKGVPSSTVDKRLNMIVVTDVPSVIKRVKEVIQRLDQVTPQVIIEARIVEANTNFTRDLGFDWGEVTAGPFEVGDADLTLRGLASNLPTAVPSGVAGFDFVKLSGTPFTIIDAKLVVSETEGKTNIISAPKVVTLDNKKAKIKQGLEVPYQERDSSGNSTIRFKNVDLLLEVTPNVTPDDRIMMKIFVTKNDVAEQTPDGPALSTNEAETELLIDNGDTIVIGGIVKSTITYGEKGIPGLRKIGVLGWLFKSQSKQDAKNELLIFITPRIVQLKQKPGIEI